MTDETEAALEVMSARLDDQGIRVELIEIAVSEMLATIRTNSETLQDLFEMVRSLPMPATTTERPAPEF